MVQDFGVWTFRQFAQFSFNIESGGSTLKLGDIESGGSTLKNRIYASHKSFYDHWSWRKLDGMNAKPKNFDKEPCKAGWGFLIEC